MNNVLEEPTIFVPGKAMLMGEYAVLDGGPAIVSAINCYAKATLQPNHPETPPSSLIKISVKFAKERLKQRGIPSPTGYPTVDTSDFFRQSKKLGLGSSAAVAVSSIAALFHAADFSLQSSVTRSEIQMLAFKAHQQFQETVGSGADVLASTWGGIHILNSLVQPKHQLPVHFCLVATPTSASTKELIHFYQKISRNTQNPTIQMNQATELFLHAWERKRPDLLFSAVETAFECFQLLGHLFGVPLITADHQIIRDLAKSLGGAAKPSGAGGGDISIVFLPSTQKEQELRLKLPAHLELLNFCTDSLGIRSNLEFS